jgi:hypothetical protein
LSCRRISLTVANFANSGRGTHMGTDTLALSTVENVPAGTLLLSATRGYFGARDISGLEPEDDSADALSTSSGSPGRSV